MRHQAKQTCQRLQAARRRLRANGRVADKQRPVARPDIGLPRVLWQRDAEMALKPFAPLNALVMATHSPYCLRDSGSQGSLQALAAMDMRVAYSAARFNLKVLLCVFH